jgi:GT2 family glycosyltransferase
MAVHLRDADPRGLTQDSSVDVIVVTYNSREHLGEAVEPLVALPDIHVTVVDNASTDGTLEIVADLPVETIRLDANVGFSAGCNAGWRTGTAPFVLLLNPDASIDADSIRVLAAALAKDPQIGVVGPLIVNSDGSLDFSQRRFPRRFSTWARALFLHRLAPRASWSDEALRDPRAYESSRAAEWLSGACLLVRRNLLEAVGGLDERFFLYCEDQDLCKAVRDAGYDVRFEPAASCVHAGGASAPRASLSAVGARSRLLYAGKHHGRTGLLLEWLGLVLHSLTHAIAARERNRRRGHLRALGVLGSFPFDG